TGATMRATRVCIHGGTDLHETMTQFISVLAYKILDSMPAVIVTGGFLHSNERPLAVSTDAAPEGARRYANDRKIDPKGCYEARSTVTNLAAANVPDTVAGSIPDLDRLTPERRAATRTSSLLRV